MDLITKDIDISLVKNPYDFNLNDLVQVGERLNNPKRNFLFVSKVLGKHLSVKPNILKSIGYLLGNEIYPNNNFDISLIIDYIKNPTDEDAIKKELKKYIEPVNDKPFVIGFAETATALGMSVASSIKDSYYITTTREKLPLKSFFDFEEAHSHATDHRCYLINKLKFIDSKTVILVDDEITTGNTMINLIKELDKICSDKRYVVVSIMDSRNQEYIDKCNKFAKNHNIDLSFKSLISTKIKIKNNNIYSGDNEDIITTKTDNIKYLKGFNKVSYNSKKYTSVSGRFGVSFDDITGIEKTAKLIADKIRPLISEKDKVLVLGHGEDIYIPSRVANYLSPKAMFKTTSRSPIYTKDIEGYPIKQRSSFNIDDVTYYLYNKDLLEKMYDKIFFISEFDMKFKLLDKIQVINI